LTIGLSVIGQPLALVGQMVPVHTKEDVASYQTAMQPERWRHIAGAGMTLSIPFRWELIPIRPSNWNWAISGA